MRFFFFPDRRDPSSGATPEQRITGYLVFRNCWRCLAVSPIAVRDSDFYLGSRFDIIVYPGYARKLRARERERERTLVQRWTVIALYYSKVIGAEYRETWFLIRDIICSTTWALFHELAGRKQIVP